MTRVKKNWGTEVILANTELYCLKNLYVQPGWQCSTHYHVVKDETFICQRGHGFVWVENETFEMLPGTAVRVLPGQWHFFFCPHSEREPLALLEVSTHHCDDDVERDPEHPSRPIARSWKEAERGPSHGNLEGSDV